MRSVYLLICVFLSVIQSFAQELRQMRLVGDATKSDDEIVTRRDINGNLTAGVMIISDMDGFSYDAYNGVVGNVDSRPGMDIVYLTTNERVLEIYKSGYQPMKIILSDLGIRLKPQEVWQIKITGDPLPPLTIPVTIWKTPSDAMLTIDGQPAALSGPYALVPGEHQLKIEKEGYATIEEIISVSDKQVFFEYTMERNTEAELQIETIPSDAFVYLDGFLLGKSPVKLTYPIGNYSLRVVKAGYITIENETLEVTWPQTQRLFELEKSEIKSPVETNATKQEKATIKKQGARFSIGGQAAYCFLFVDELYTNAGTTYSELSGAGMSYGVFLSYGRLLIDGSWTRRSFENDVDIATGYVVFDIDSYSMSFNLMVSNRKTLDSGWGLFLGFGAANLTSTYNINFLSSGALPDETVYFPKALLTGSISKSFKLYAAYSYYLAEAPFHELQVGLMIGL